MPQKKAPKKKNIWLKRILRTILFLVVFVFILLLFIRSSWGQNIIVDQVTNYISKKTNTEVNLDYLYITFDGNLKAEGLYLEDKSKDTLLYAKSIEANLPLWDLISGKKISIDDVDLENVTANILRKDTINSYNFQFLVDAFATENPQAIQQDTTQNDVLLPLKTFDFTNINVTYNDAVLGIKSQYKVGTLEATIDTFNITKMIFTLDDIAVDNSKITYIQNPPLVKSDEAAPLPKLAGNDLLIKNTQFYYEDTENKLITDFDIPDLNSEFVNINLEKSIYNIADVQLNNSTIVVKTDAPRGSETNNNTTLTLPEILVDINRINFANNSFSYTAGSASVKSNQFNPEALSFSNINMLASDIKLKNSNASLQLENLNFKESSGLRLKQLAFSGNLSNQNLRINNLKFTTNQNSLRGSLRADYNSFDSFIDNPETVFIDADLSSINLNLQEFIKYQPSLKTNIYFKELSKKPIKGSFFANGNLANINLYNTDLNWGKTTNITIEGSIKNVTDINNLQLNLPDFKAKTIKDDIVKFIPQDSLQFNLPEEMVLTGSLQGSLNNINTDVTLASSQGKIFVDGSFNNQNNISFNTDIVVEDYDIGKFLNNNQLGKVSIRLTSEGTGKTINDLDASLNAVVTETSFRNYKIDSLKLDGNFTNGLGTLTSNYKDSNLNINLKSTIDLDSVNTKASADINVIGADLQGLGVSNRNIKTGMDISLDFSGNLEDYSVESEVINGAVVYDNKTFLLGSITADAYVTKDTTAVSFKNKMINLELNSNTDPQRFSTALEKHIFSYFYRDEVLTDTIENPINIKFKGKIAQTPLLEEVFLVNVKDIDTIDIALDFNQLQRKLDAKITAPHINYSGNEIDSLAFTMNTSKEDFNFNLGFKDIKAGALDVPRTSITGNQKNNELSLNFSGIHNQQLMMNIDAKISGNRDSLVLRVNPKDLVLNKHQWNIDKDNKVELLNNNKLEFLNFKITKDNQSIAITDDYQNMDNNHVAIVFNGFQIKEFFNYLNPEQQLATGILNGKFILEKPFTDTGIVADLKVDNLNVINTDFGKLSIAGESLGNGKYDFKAALKEGDINLDLTGDYIVANNTANLNLDLDINSFKMKALETLTLGELKNTSGDFSGHFKLSGTLANPTYNGALNFKNSKFNITKFNADFTLPNEKLEVNNKGLFMNNLTILDAKQNKLTLKGNIGTESFINPDFNLELRADNFRLLNATKEDNSAIYGKASFSANAELTGDLQIPKLTATVTLGSDTNVTYVLPATYANIERRDEIVAFVNRENPNAILTETEEQTATVRGFDIFTKLNINKKAAITIVLNEDTGDNFNISGDGEFLFSMLPNGRVSLTGNYEVAKGHYELNLYELVNRRFELVPGGNVSWSGDPLDANLDVSALYNISTSAAPLMATQISDEDPSIKNRFKQVLPFNVYLNIDGELTQPKISFDLGMPEESQGAIGGQVYGRVQQVNQQEEELNKQVFSLLVLNKFYPTSGNDGSLGGFSTIARDNLNDAVSGQLNTFSDRILGDSNIDLNFDLNSYTDYQGSAVRDRTQLGITAETNLFSDRLTVKVGSNLDIDGANITGEQTPLIGNVTLEYKITEDGRYRLKGFRKTEFENVIDGQTIVSGVALIFTQEFNEFIEMWNAIFRSTNEKKERDEKKAKEELAKKEAKTDKSIKQKKN